MKVESIAFATFLAVSVLGGSVLAEEPDKHPSYRESSMGVVIFDCGDHQQSGLGCIDCHNEIMFHEMKFGSHRIAMNDLFAGKYCGKCHDGERVFRILENCTLCHHVEN